MPRTKPNTTPLDGEPKVVRTLMAALRHLELAFGSPEILTHEDQLTQGWGWAVGPRRLEIWPHAEDSVVVVAGSRAPVICFDLHGIVDLHADLRRQQIQDDVVHMQRLVTPRNDPWPPAEK